MKTGLRRKSEGDLTRSTSYIKGLLQRNHTPQGIVQYRKVCCIALQPKMFGKGLATRSNSSLRFSMNPSNLLATLSLIFTKTVSNSRLRLKIELLIKKCVSVALSGWAVQRSVPYKSYYMSLSTVGSTLIFPTLRLTLYIKSILHPFFKTMTF